MGNSLCEEECIKIPSMHSGSRARGYLVHGRSRIGRRNGPDFLIWVLETRMAILSKILGQAAEGSCFELGHTWTPSCSVAFWGVFRSCALESLKIYGALYLVSILDRALGRIDCVAPNANWTPQRCLHRTLAYP